MKVITGYLYHIKDEFFDKINAKSVMINHKNGHSRPSYLAIKDGKILWFIPLSSKIQKYQKIVNRKIKKYGECKTILIKDTEPSNLERPLEPFLSERLFITKSPFKTNFLLSPSLDFAAFSNCGPIPFLVTDNGG